MSFNSVKTIVKPQDVFQSIKATLVITSIQSPSVQDAERRRDELESLCLTAGIKTVAWDYIKVREINPATYIGTGQVAKLANLAMGNKSNLIVFNEAVSPRIQRNLEAATSLCVVDRQEIILQIFANRATTREATLQVELAQLQYSLPRLSRKWANLSQQRGGVKGAKGSGEKQLELDKRVAQKRITHLKEEIEQIAKHRGIQRHNRTFNDIKNCAIVGYTNSGKSTFLNRISQAGVLSENKLFATLDTTTRKVYMPGGHFVLFTDTVGFVSDLPHELVDAFKSTLEEAALADLLLIVLDASRDDLMMCYDTTLQTLESIGANNIPKLILLNKMDQVTEENMFAIQAFKAKEPNTLCVSVLNDNMREVLAHIEKIIF